MSLIYNGTTISKLVYNGTSIQSATYNGTSVFTAGVDPSKTSYTEEEFIEVVNAGIQGTMIVGTTVTLTNTYCSSYSVIGTNHDGTSGTVDLYCDKCCKTDIKFSNGSPYNMWESSYVRTWLNDTYINAFTNVSSLLKTMIVSTNGSTTSDKAKLLSCTEIGATSSYMLTGEGTKYEAFSSHTSGVTGFSDVWRSGNSYNWLRSRYTGGGNIYVMYAGINGRIEGRANSCEHGIAPVIRF